MFAVKRPTKSSALASSEVRGDTLPTTGGTVATPNEGGTLVPQPKTAEVTVEFNGLEEGNVGVASSAKDDEPVCKFPLMATIAPKITVALSQVYNS